MTPTGDLGPPCVDCDGPPYACANCRRPVQWVDGVGWLHGSLPQYAGEPAAGDPAEPVHRAQRSRHH